jgi:hypothetical protein
VTAPTNPADPNTALTVTLGSISCTSEDRRGL